MNASEILEGVLEEFKKIAKIPRKSGYEQEVSNFLKKYLEDLGFVVTQDEVNNIIAEVSGTTGYEDVSRIAIQAHMDMVCIAEEGRAYDPLKDGIELIRTEEYLSANGTSLGADDGIGIAEAIFIVKHLKKHGPIRLIITVDEEQGMIGAINLEKKYLQDVTYLINCDSENYDELTVGSAGSINLDFSRKINRISAENIGGWVLELRGLRGGHSGERIGEGRANAIKSIAFFLKALMDEGKIELSRFSGGKARNAIPDFARAEFATDLSDVRLYKIFELHKKHFYEIYGDIEPTAKFELKKSSVSHDVLESIDLQRLLQLLLLLHTGVYAMSCNIPTLVETSANVGVLTMEEGEVSVSFFPRSSIDQKLTEFNIMAQELAALTGFELHTGTQSPGWKEQKNSRLAKLMASIFEKQNGKPMRIATIHAGLECGWHFLKNPALDIVSIGVTTYDIHTPKERLVLSTVEPQVKLIMETIEQIADGEKIMK